MLKEQQMFCGMVASGWTRAHVKFRIEALNGALDKVPKDNYLNLAFAIFDARLALSIFNFIERRESNESHK